MNEDFEEDYDNDDDGLQDFQDAIDKGKDAKEKFNEEKKARTEKKQSEGTEGRSGEPKGDSPPSKPDTVSDSAKQPGKDALNKSAEDSAKNVAKDTVKKGAEDSAKNVAKEGTKQIVKETGKQAAVKGTVTATKAIPYVGAIIAALDAAWSALKAINKHDKKMREKGIDTKNMRRMFLMFPVLIPVLIVVLIIVIFVALTQGSTTDRVQILQDALVCFETSGADSSCQDFMNTGVHLGEYRLRQKIFSEGIDETWLYKYSEAKPLIKRTDMEISWFLNDFLLIEKVLNLNAEQDFINTLSGLVPLDFDDTTAYNEDAMIADMQASGLLTEDNIDEIHKTDVYIRQSYLYKWLKMEKKIFNQIKWNYGSIHRISTGWLNEIGDALTFTVFNSVTDPAEVLRSAVTRGFHWTEISGFDWDIGTAFLKKPREIEIDEAISLAEPYLPSFVEIYATLMATGSYSMADRVYEYYVKNIHIDGTMPLVITIFEQMSLRTVFKDLDSINQTKVYYKNTTGDSNGLWQEITENEYNTLRADMEAEIRSNNSDRWNKIKDWFNNLWNEIEQMISNLSQWCFEMYTTVVNKMGWDTEITRDFIAVVEQGHAYEYKVNRDYKLDAETYMVQANDIQLEEKTERFPATPIDMDISYSYEEERQTNVCEEWYPTVEGETPECKEYKTETETVNGTYSGTPIQLQVKSVITWNQVHTITENIAIPVVNDVSKYTDIVNGEEQEYKNRYVWVLDQIEEEEREAFSEQKNDAVDEGVLDEFLKQYSLVTANEMAFAVDIIDAHYTETFGLVGGISAGDFVMAGSLNTSFVNYAKQFEGRKLHEMIYIDDTNTFFSDHWCAMFVSFCMKKANVPIPKFYQCARFWSDNKDKPGFFDVADANNNGYITDNPDHITTLNNIQPGDIILFKTNVNNRARTHTGICVSVEKDVAGNVSKITAIEGNTGNPNFNKSKVSIQTYTGSNLKTIASFVSIATVQASGGWI